eukprot:scaffold71136_cov67-Phaeocystis_antarctica.AAC.1
MLSRVDDLLEVPHAHHAAVGGVAAAHHRLPVQGGRLRVRSRLRVGLLGYRLGLDEEPQPIRQQRAHAHVDQHVGRARHAEHALALAWRPRPESARRLPTDALEG